jgi:hypothetical protein
MKLQIVKLTLKKRGPFMDANIIERLKETKIFVTEVCTKLLSPDENQNAKQVYILDNQGNIQDTMKFLTDVRNMLSAFGDELAEGSEEEKVLELTCALSNKLSKTLEDFKNGIVVNKHATVADTTASVTEETIKNAVQNDKSTQQIVKDMNEINQKASITQIQEFTHAFYVGGKFLYYKAQTETDLNAYLNELIAANPSGNVQVFAVSLTPIQLKKKTIYTV